MIGISQLYAGTATSADPLRYGRHSGRLPAHLLRFSEDRKPVVGTPPIAARRKA